MIKNQVISDLLIISVIGVSFRYSGRNISLIGVIRIQFKPLPPTIAATLRIEVGTEQKLSVSFVKFMGRQLLGPHIVARRKRIVYAVVNPVAMRNKTRNIKFIE